MSLGADALPDPSALTDARAVLPEPGRDVQGVADPSATPLIQQSYNAIAAEQPVLPIARGQVNILLVDDRDDKLLALEVTLSPLGHNLVKAKSGKDALRLLLKQDFAVILLDVSMPGMDGFETAALIRQRPSSETTPIIFVTSVSASPNDMYQGYSLGAVDYILTPIVPEVLRAKVSVFVELFLKTEQVRLQGERLRQMEEAQHRRALAEAVDLLEAQTKRNRFFTLALDLLGIADSNGHLLQVNPTWEKVLGYSQEELRATSGTDLVHPEERAALLQHVEDMRRTGTPSAMEARFRCKDGSYRWLGWTAAPFNAENLLYIFARDITARKNAEHEIQRLNVELQHRVNALIEVNRELESFNYSISHDLRAPLRSMQSFAQALLEDSASNLSPDGIDFLGRIMRSGKYMDTLLHDLLAYSRLARADFEVEPVDIDLALSDVLNQLHKDIKDKQARIEVGSPLGKIVGHQPILKQILSNLLSNALKFVTPDTAPHLRISAEHVTRGAEHVGQGREQVGRGVPAEPLEPAASAAFIRVIIEDNGIGIHPDHHKKIFGLFERLHPAHAYPGTGIGLALVRKGIERLNGELGLSSTPGHGSRFWFELLAANERPPCKE